MRTTEKKGYSRKEVIAELARRARVNQTVAELVLDSFTSLVIEAASRDWHVALRGFGAFRPRDVPARRGFNFNTRETVSVPPRKALAFVPAEGLRNLEQGA